MKLKNVARWIVFLVSWDPPQDDVDGAAQVPVMTFSPRW